MAMDNNDLYYGNNPMSDTKQAYQEYSWLFGDYKNRR